MVPHVNSIHSQCYVKSYHNLEAQVELSKKEKQHDGKIQKITLRFPQQDGAGAYLYGEGMMYCIYSCL